MLGWEDPLSFSLVARNVEPACLAPFSTFFVLLRMKSLVASIVNTECERYLGTLCILDQGLPYAKSMHGEDTRMHLLL